MTDTLCSVDGCGRPTRDRAYLCDRDAAMLVADLGDVVWLEPELEVTLTRQDRVGDSAGGGHSKRAEEPLLYSRLASEVGYIITNTITSWARHIHEERGGPAPQAGAGATNAARWLLGHVEWLKHRPESVEAYGEITSAVAMARMVIDRHAPRWYAGPCLTPAGDGTECAEDMYGVAGAPVVRCRVCGAEHDAAHRQSYLLRVADDTLAHAELIGRAAAALGVEITPADVREYASRRLIVAHGIDAAGRPLYRFGDVVETSRAIADRKAARSLIAAGQRARRAAGVAERDKAG